MLEEEDNDEELFWSYFLLSFYKNRWVPEEMKKRAEAMLDKGTSFSRLWLVYFINDITEIGTQVTMVLDNLEVIKDEKIINNLEFLIRHLPSNVHLILSGREALGIGLSKNKASGEAFELTGKELSFTQEETISFFRNRVQINLSQEEYSKINRAFEGWAAGIVLLAMTIKKTEALTVPHSTGNHLIYTYLMEEVISGLEDEIKNFLFKTAFLKRFCPELCDFLFQTDNAGEIIAKLEKKNLFIVCVDEKEGWFRCQRVFRDFLQTLPQENTKISEPVLYQKASEWYEEKRYQKEAIHYAVKGRDFNKAVRLIEELSGEIGCRGESGLLHKWNRYLPKEIVENNLRLLLNSAWAYSLEGNTSQLFLCMQKIRKFEVIPAKLQAEITALYSSNLEGPKTQLDEMLIECRKILKHLTPKEFLMQLICFNIGGILLLQGSVKEGVFYFKYCYTNSMNTKNLYLAVISKKAIITSQIRNGQLHKAEKEIMEFLKVLSCQGGETLPVIGLLYAQLAEIYYLRNELGKAQDMAMKGSGYGELGGDIWTIGENCLIMEKIYKAAENKKQYEISKAKALSCLEGRSYFDLSFKLECYHIQTLILEGRLTLASRKISTLEQRTDPKLNLVYPEFVFIKARFYISKGKLKKAEEILLALKSAAKTEGQEGVLCEIQVLLSIVYEKMGSSIQALDELEYGVSLAREQGSFQLFLNEGELMEGMLKRLTEVRDTKTTNTIFMEGLFCCFEGQRKTRQESGEILSRREMDILNLVAQGVGNEEIADKLFVSKNTVKTHLLNIYTKLGVHSRTKAVSKAEELNIITFHRKKDDC